MIRAGLDSNILVYAELEPESDKGRKAHRLIELCAPRGILAVQTLLEFIAVVRRKRPESLASARAKVEVWAEVFETAPTSLATARAAFDLMRDHRLQVWDAVIWSALSEAGASVFFSEDMQDGFVHDGLRVRNPFAADDGEVARLLES